MKILIRNLPRTLSENELEELFKVYGEVQSCTLILDKATGESKGFGFVEIAKVGNAKAAVQALNGKHIDGNKIRVKKADISTTK
jgi:RNA recognition motif-containing protein